MIVERLILKEYDWAITVLLDCDCSDTPNIISHLKSINCPLYLQSEALENLNTCKKNIGLTYSNFSLRRTIMVVSKTNSTKELINTITHECYHFVRQLLAAIHIQDEEILASITGRFNMCLLDTIYYILLNSN